MKTILLTGFEPFGGAQANASAEVVRLLDGRQVAGWTVHGVILPCVFRKTRAALANAMRQVRPSLVVCLGEAAGRNAITPELVAVNHTDARIPDNVGHQPVDTPVVRGGPAAFWSLLPVRRIAGALERKGVPAAVSRSAGGFVCNHLFYQLMHGLEQSDTACTGGFIHVPAAGTDGWPPARIAGGIELALAVSVRAAEAKARNAGGRRRSERRRPEPGKSNKRSRGSGPR